MDEPGRAPSLENADRANINIGIIAPLSQPGWVDAGEHLIAGFNLALEEVNGAGGVLGRPLGLVVRDTAADAQKAADAVDELSKMGVVALAGEYHSVVARCAAARADAVGLPYLCTSAVIDELTRQPTDWIARLATPQSRGWRVYADFLQSKGHKNIAIAADPASIYWASGRDLLLQYLSPHGATTCFDVREHMPDSLCHELVCMNGEVTILLLLVGHPEPAISIVQAVRGEKRLDNMMIGAPAGQPELSEWVTLLGNKHSAGIPFLRYLPENPTPLGIRVEKSLRERLGVVPSFVALEAYDAILVLVEMLRLFGADRTRLAQSWSHIVVQGTRGLIQFSRVDGSNVWQWAESPVQVADRNPAQLNEFRTLHVG